MTSASSVGGDGRLRLFLALELPPETLDVLVRWGDERLSGGRVVPREQLHVTLAFLGSRPAGELEAIVAALGAAVAGGSGRIELTPSEWRETRSVGMVVLDDLGEEATRLAGRLHGALGALGVYRPSRDPGCPTSPRSASASDRGSRRRSRRREHSFRPTRLLSCLVCTRPEPGTRCWNVSR